MNPKIFPLLLSQFSHCFCLYICLKYRGVWFLFTFAKNLSKIGWNASVNGTSLFYSNILDLLHLLQGCAGSLVFKHVVYRFLAKIFVYSKFWQRGLNWVRSIFLFCMKVEDEEHLGVMCTWCRREFTLSQKYPFCLFLQVCVFSSIFRIKLEGPHSSNGQYIYLSS